MYKSNAAGKVDTSAYCHLFQS